jgi:predicted TIM-barrel fold metal-dependent hydrolase
MSKEPIINCHTHVFTGDHVPPFLAKTYVPAPFYWLIHLGFIVSVFRFWYKYPARIPHTIAYKKLVKAITAVRAFFTRLYPLDKLLWLYIFLYVLYLIYRVLAPVAPPDNKEQAGWLQKAADAAASYFPDISETWLRVLIILVVLIFFRSIRKLVFTFAKRIWKVLGKLPGPETKELAARYLNIGRYAFHQQQTTIVSKLKGQYPKGTGFVVLPMDMEYMNAGKTKTRYRDQMEELKDIKENNEKTIFPFVFADPRRMVPVKDEINYQPGDKPYFEWDLVNGSIVLKDCFMKDYLEVHRFSGIKIYPALGYYPFDARLLPLWKYCADHQVPILTHCIRGTIFYRGRKKQEWNRHQVFRQAMGKEETVTTNRPKGKLGKNAKEDGYPEGEIVETEKTTLYEPLVLAEFKNVEFSYNFTHPMNYLCLLEEELLRGLITDELQRDPGSRLGLLFGYRGPENAMEHNLRNLKICMGHFGGDDEWRRYFEKDRYNFSSQLSKYPDHGIRFFKTINNDPSLGKPEQLWKYTDWYSIICSMILQYPNVYADISYILHDDADILPLLKQTLLNPGLREKVLYGTDFFVVRNHKSDKNMLADMMGGLSVEDFDQVARANPRAYLKNTLPQLVTTATSSTRQQVQG